MDGAAYSRRRRRFPVAIRSTFGQTKVMLDRFTDRARKVMELANGHAQRLGHEYLGTEHILLGLVEEDTGVAAKVLEKLQVDLRKVTRGVEAIVQGGSGKMGATARIPQTPRAKKVIECAIDEARKLKHNYVGSEHLLLGLLREEEGVAAQVLMNLGLTLKSVRDEIVSLLGYTKPGDSVPRLGTSPQIKLPQSEAQAMEFDMDMGDESAADKMQALFGPGQIDQYVRQAIQFCWMSLPKQRRTLEELETQIRRLVERALRDFREDSQAFGGESPQA
jgi:ATP-dependent Clp protease ATP-binding subunit ClpC